MGSSKVNRNSVIVKIQQQRKQDMSFNRLTLSDIHAAIQNEIPHSNSEHHTKTVTQSTVRNQNISGKFS